MLSYLFKKLINNHYKFTRNIMLTYYIVTQVNTIKFLSEFNMFSN